METLHTRAYISQTHLVSVSDHGIGQLPRHQLVEDHSIGVHIRLETVGVIVLHPKYLWSLCERDRVDTSTGELSQVPQVLSSINIIQAGYA